MAHAYTEIFNDAIYPSTVQSFTGNAQRLGLLVMVRKGTRGANGKPTVYALADTVQPQAWGIPGDMMLRQQWERIAAEVRSGVAWT